MLPFHCLVLCDRGQFDLFPQHERLSSQLIAYDLVGDDRRDLQPIVVAELRHRLALKLSLGQRVAVLMDRWVAEDKHQLIALAKQQGAAVIDLVGKSDLCQFVQSLPSNPYDYLRSSWRGITIIGDVHGDLQAMTTAMAWARARENFVWLLGDVIDYGAETLATADLAYHAVMAGTAGMILGNHERKIARWLDQRNTGKAHFRVSSGNRVTIAALEATDVTTRRQWVGRFRSLLGHASLMQQIGNVTLVHAAAHPSLWGNKPNFSLIEQFALYGEADHSSGNFHRVHRWVDAIPLGQTVFVGHDVMGAFPIVTTGAKGGHVVHLDTGCGTGGRLSTADLRFDATGLHLECFNRH